MTSHAYCDVTEADKPSRSGGEGKRREGRGREGARGGEGGQTSCHGAERHDGLLFTIIATVHSNSSSFNFKAGCIHFSKN